LLIPDFKIKMVLVNSKSKLVF